MKKSEATIKNRQGIHVRPSGVIITESGKIQSAITLKSKGFEMPLMSIMDLLALGLQHGDTVEISVDGDDEDSALPILVELFEREYDFPPRE